jgi:hypothetical protein
MGPLHLPNETFHTIAFFGVFSVGGAPLFFGPSVCRTNTRVGIENGSAFQSALFQTSSVLEALSNVSFHVIRLNTMCHGDPNEANKPGRPAQGTQDNEQGMGSRSETPGRKE